MGKRTKIWLIIASSLLVVGCIIFGGVMTMLNWDFTKLSTVKYETNDYKFNEGYENISIVTKTADILFLPSENGETSVTCHEQKKVKHSVSVNNGTLMVEVEDTRKWYEYIGINFGSPKITVCLPKAEYSTLSISTKTGDIEISKDFKFESVDISLSTGDIDLFASASKLIKIKTGTGDIHVEGVSAGTLELSASTGGITVLDVTCEGDVKTNISTGKTNLSNIKCQNVISNGSTGNVVFKNVIAVEKFSIKRSTGDISFVSSDATEIFAETDTGNVTGSLLTNKVFITKTDTGNVDVPKTVTGGKCEINTNTGDIKITLT